MSQTQTPEQAPTVVVYHKRRNVELFMLVLACAVGIGAYWITSMNLLGESPANLPYVAGVWLGLALLCHIVVRWRLPYADPLILPCVFFLNGLGLVMIHRLDLATRYADEPANDAVTQLMWTVLAVGVLIFGIFVVRDYRPLQRFTYTLALLGIGLLLLPLVPGIGRTINGSSIWIGVGPFSFQPSEVAKIALAIAFSSYLVEKRDVLAMAGARILGIDLPRPRDLGPILIVWGVAMAILVFQRDLGTSLLFFGLFVMMIYVATERPGWAVLGLLMFAGGGFLGYSIFGHVRTRVQAWLDPFADPEANYQVIQGLFGFAWGGMTGTGLGLGQPWRTPLAKSDYIMASIGEELGVAGLMAVIMVYAILVARALRTALASREPFGKLLAAGLGFVWALQVFAIVGGVTKLLPLTGLTTPFMSQGGSSLLANWTVAGLLLIISHQVRRPVITGPALVDNESTQVINRPRGVR
ncbi:FtsW/RodA/SpoVE family cell cycle protein [Naumannella halotolerans]|uniref:Cell division protein FtsW (Lipid II flippase) n=1 Tax=Naumannella halotolerans TaxID=993414 RepID=A0A4R7IYW1_9ACTN|nr:FtsW/RodA/SpoVE family cell cycle protein [Naumannella halotolerans]TDT29133.1 cell division protein FtsW (lipid II flippase) [Naumannella halotolerans]